MDKVQRSNGYGLEIGQQPIDDSLRHDPIPFAKRHQCSLYYPVLLGNKVVIDGPMTKFINVF